MISALVAVVLALPPIPNPQGEVKAGFAHTQDAAPPSSLQMSAPFTVSFYNSSAKPITLLSEHCSWGYESLSFDLLNPAGRHSTITRRPRAWDKNYPMPIVVPCGDVLLRNVNLTDGTWQGMPPGVAGSIKGWKLRALLTVQSDPMFGNKGFWTGKTSSGWAPITP